MMNAEIFGDTTAMFMVAKNPVRVSAGLAATIGFDRSECPFHEGPDRDAWLTFFDACPAATDEQIKVSAIIAYSKGSGRETCPLSGSRRNVWLAAYDDVTAAYAASIAKNPCSNRDAA